MGTIATVSIEELAPEARTAESDVGAAPGSRPPGGAAAARPSIGALLAAGALDRLEEVDRAASLYKDESDLVRINRTGWPGPAPIAGILGDLLGLSLDIARRTGGAFDPTVKPLLDELGFYREIGSVRDPAGMKGALARVGWKKVRYDPARHLVRFDRTAMALDFGGIGKGYALDLAAAYLRANGVARARLDLGRSSSFLIGRDPASKGGRFRISVSSPDSDEGERIQAFVFVPEGSVATSAPSSQVRYEGKREVGHIVDPRCGILETSVRSATVWAPDGAVADALATALVVAGPRGLGRFARRFRFEALLIVAGKKGPRFVATPGLAWSPATDAARAQAVPHHDPGTD